MANKTLEKIFVCASLLGVLLFPMAQVAEQAAGGASKKPYLGTWKGICADGEESVVLKLSESGD